MHFSDDNSDNGGKHLTGIKFTQVSFVNKKTSM